MSNFITRRSFFFNLTAAIVIAVAVTLIAFFSLDKFTKHGQQVKVPNVIGMRYDKAIQVLEAANLQAFVQDSVYYDSLPPLSVIAQTPSAEIKGVKPERMVYLTINRAKAPLVEMPDLRGFSHTSAQFLLRSFGLKEGTVRYIPDLGKDVVKEQRLDSLRDINPGTKVAQGTVIHLSLGDGKGSPTMQVPNLTGMTFAEARQYLQSMNLKVGDVYLDAGVTDTLTAIVYRQDPERDMRDEIKKGTRYTRVKYGYPINLWIKLPGLPSLGATPDEDASTDETPDNDN